MFHRRRSQSNPLNQNPHPSAAAATAAAQAFLAHQPSSPSLSAAAAATALRTHTPSPIPVENVQTKRMVRRKTSLSSNGSFRGTGKRANLRRVNSNGSMTERTFRETPPGQHRNAVVPPVPSVPPSPIGKLHRRATSLDPPVRTTSSQIRQQKGRGTSLDRQPSVTLASLAEENADAIERSNSRNSINFSYPKQAWNTPPGTPNTHDDVSSRRRESPEQSGLQAHELADVEYSIQEAAKKPVKRKKKTVATGFLEGSHLKCATVGGRLKGTAIETGSASDATHIIESEPRLVPPPSAEQDSGRQGKRQSSRVTPRSTPSPEFTSFVEGGAASNQSRPLNSRASGALARHPSIVREEVEAEELAEKTEEFNDGPYPLLHSHASSSSRQENAAEAEESRAATGQVRDRGEQTAATSSEASQERHVTKATSTEGLHGERSSSLSPNRSAHFSSHPIITGLHEPKHEPPPRSVSPAKPALKHSPLLPPVSSVEGDPHYLMMPSGSYANDLSDAASSVSDDLARTQSKKKKNVRVSFDEGPVIVGTAASPPTSPESSVSSISPRSRYSGRQSDVRKERSTGDSRSSDIDDSYESFGPVPRLPSFGSIRGKSRQEHAEKQRQQESDSETSTTQNRRPEDLHVSSDGAIGHMLAKLNENEASPFKPEPRRPSGIMKISKEKSAEDADDVSNVDMRHAETARRPSEMPSNTVFTESRSPHTEERIATTTLLFPPKKSAETLGTGIPIIAVEPASPAPGELPGHKQYFIVQDPMEQSKGHDASTGWDNMPSDDDSDTSGDSIYSDAAEDPAELVDTGFASIDTVVESTTQTLPMTTMTTRSRLPRVREASSQTEADILEPCSPSDSLALSPQPLILPEDALPQRCREKIGNTSTISTQTKVMPKRTKKKSAQVVSSDEAPLPPWPDKRYKRVMGTETQSSLKESTRIVNQPPPSNQSKVNGKAMRSSMRSGTSHPAVDTKTVPEPRGTLQKRYKPPSKAVSTTQIKKSQSLDYGTNHTSGLVKSKTGLRSKKTNGATTVMPGLQRVPSDASDSSYQRINTFSSKGGRISMRKTMRGSSVEQRLTSPAVGRTLSVRSASPFGTEYQGRQQNGSTLRTSMRSMSVDERKSARFPGFGKKNRAKPARMGSVGFSSRFHDSSDDDDDQPVPTYQGRFHDSSDDEPGPSFDELTPVRGIPRQQDDGDSTDLEDSSSDEDTATEQARRPKTLTEGRQNSGFANGSAAFRTERKKRSFFGNFGRKKGVSRAQDINFAGVSRTDPLDGRENDQSTGIKTSGTQKRHHPKKDANDSWPLSTGPLNRVTENPENANTFGKPRTSPYDDQAAGNQSIGSSRTGKKKKFPLLRKAFGLDT